MSYGNEFSGTCRWQRLRHRQEGLTMHGNTSRSLEHCKSVLLLFEVLLDLGPAILEPVLAPWLARIANGKIRHRGNEH